MPPLTALSRIALRRRFLPSFSPVSPFSCLSRSSSSVELSPYSAALFLPASSYSTAAKILLKAKELPSLSYLGLDAKDSQTLLLDQAIGLVATAQANFMRVIVETAGGAAETPAAFGPDPRIGMELLCVVRALLKKVGWRILVGDRVLVGAVAWNNGRGVIEDLYQRTSRIIDPPIANVDHLLLLFSMEQPKPDPFTLTRFLVEAESTGIPFTLALNKVELASNQTLSSWDSRIHAWGYRPMFCSVECRSGLDILQDILKGRTTVVMGPSGVGKSSLINCLRSKHLFRENEVVDVIGEKSGNMRMWLENHKKTGTGKHATHHVSLHPLSGGGFLADTPGFNLPSLLKVSKRILAQTFPEIRYLLAANAPVECSFTDCLHIGEPGCVINLEWERYPYYFQLLDEIKIREEFQLCAVGTKREADVRYKMGEMGAKHAEPRLEAKKHRRISRKQLNQTILDQNDLFDIEGYLSDGRGGPK